MNSIGVGAAIGVAIGVAFGAGVGVALQGNSTDGEQSKKGDS